MNNTGILIDGVSETVKNEIKRQEGWFLGMLLGTLDASMLRNILTGKGVLRNGKGVIRARRRYDNMGHMDQNF